MSWTFTIYREFWPMESTFWSLSTSSSTFRSFELVGWTYVAKAERPEADVNSGASRAGRSTARG